MNSWAGMRHDQRAAAEVSGGTVEDYPTTWREDFTYWFTYYWWPTKRWMPKVSLWWGYHVHRFPKPPPLDKDAVYQRLFGPGSDSRVFEP